MFDLILLAFNTDTTRVCTFQLGREAHGGFVQSLSLQGNHHELSHHGGDQEMLNDLFKIDTFFLKRLDYFLQRLKETRFEDSTLLDETMVLYGSGMNSGAGGGHSPKNLPMLFAGGRALGLKHGQHLELPDVPLSNLFTTMLSAMGSQHSFADGTRTISELL